MTIQADYSERISRFDEAQLVYVLAHLIHNLTVENRRLLYDVSDPLSLPQLDALNEVAHQISSHPSNLARPGMRKISPIEFVEVLFECVDVVGGEDAVAKALSRTLKHAEAVFFKN